MKKDNEEPSGWAIVIILLGFVFVGLGIWKTFDLFRRDKIEAPLTSQDLYFISPAEERAQERSVQCSNVFGTSSEFITHSSYDVRTDSCYAFKIPKVHLK